MINSVQILTHLTLIQVNLPSNTKTILGNLITLSSFELLPSEKAINTFFGNKFDADDRGFNWRFVEMGYGKQNFIKNMESGFFMLFVLLFILIFFILRNYLTKVWPFRKCKSKIDNFFLNNMLNFFARIIFESYLSYTLMCFIQLGFETKSLVGEFIGLSLCGIILTILIAFPLLILLLS